MEKLLYQVVLRERVRTRELYKKYLHNADYAKHFMRNHLHGVLIPDGNILCVGCGMGRIPAMLSNLGKETVALDKSTFDTWSAIASRFLVADAEHLPFQSSLFDLCISLLVLTEVEDDCRVLDEIHRVLNPPGRLFIQVVNRNNLKTKLTGKLLYEVNKREYSTEEITRLLGEHGFELLHLNAWGFHSPLFTRLVNGVIGTRESLFLGSLLPESLRSVISVYAARM